MNYTAMTRSTQVACDVKACREFLENTVIEEGGDKYRIDGNIVLANESIVIEASSTQFAVHDEAMGEEKTKEFLLELSEFIESTMRIRSVGFTGLRHMPDAWQWNIHPDGTLEKEEFSR